jgi:hypothetical protein
VKKDNLISRNENMIPFDILSDKALNETLKKYSNYLINKKLNWRACLICDEILSIGLITCEECPLWPSEWCRCKCDASRVTTEPNDYLWWITIELELRQEEFLLKTVG